MTTRTPTRLFVCAGGAVLSGGLLALGCRAQESTPTAPVESASELPQAFRSDSRWSPPARASATNASQIDAEARRELFERVPRDRPGSTGPNGATLVGTEVDGETVAPTASAIPSAAASDGDALGAVDIGPAHKQPALSSTGLERALRASVYFPLTQQCRGPQGSILPPDSVKLEFTIGADGQIIPTSIRAEPRTDAHGEAAACMRRELGVLSFYGPPSARGVTTNVTASVPSADYPSPSPW